MKSVARCVLVVLACGMLVLGAGGCWFNTGGEEGPVVDVLIPTDVVEGEFPMGPRGEGLPGNPVTDVSFERVAFLYDSFQIADSERGKIETVGDYMNRNADVTAYIDGHCDERGSREYNLSLSEHRALAIRAYLISLGVGGDRILTRSFGEEQPLDPGHSKSAWSQNRRGEFSLYR
jgi:peptidoglycan-associated lipoprotein